MQEGETAATLNCSTSIDGRLHVWARNIVWGDNIVWGNTVHYNLPTWNLLSSPGPDGTVLGGNIVWGDNIVWADGVFWGGDLVQPLDNIVWGANIVWGDNVWGDNIVWGQSLDDNIVWGNWDNICLLYTSDAADDREV